MFSKRRSLIPTRKQPTKPEQRAAEVPPRIDLPSFKPADRRPGPGGPTSPRAAEPTARPATSGPAARPVAQPARPVSVPHAGTTQRTVPALGRPVAQPIAQPVAQPVTAPSVTPPIGTPAAADQGIGRVMLVGPDIRLNAEIRACERLVVEGAVEGELNESERLEITRGGRFRGAAEVESCVVDGLFEGELTVRGVLALKANGRVSGTVRYGEIEIERGGTIAGNFGTHGAPQGAAALRPAGNGAAAGRRPA